MTVPSTGTGPAPDTHAGDARRGDGRARRTLRVVRRSVAVLLMLAALGFMAESVTSSPRLCGSCHEMSVMASSWARSAHAGVECVSCHRPAHEWYALPVAVMQRTGLLARDTVLHLSEPGAEPMDIGPTTEEMPSAVCLQCHSANREATSGFRILIDHPEHARRNETCVSCHVRTAHPLPERGRALSLMAQCYTCHGKADMPRAGTECGLCHPEGYELEPASHLPQAWARGHGSTAKTDAEQCALCHEKAWCTQCHGVEMPHPAGWTDKGASGHAEYSKRDSTRCPSCHTEKPEPCGRCHHPSWAPELGTWQEQHRQEVRSQGVNPCLRCHETVYCVRCHVAFASDL